MTIYSNLHLILHKVRGAPSLDVAIPVTIGNEEGWIIPTSGHRAWPYATYSLNVYHDETGEAQFDITAFAEALPPMPDDVRDHYEPTGPKPSIKHKDKTTTVTELLARIGLYREPTAKAPIKRRV